MAHHHQHRVRDTSNDRKNLLMRVLSALVGLTFGFAGGKFFAQPLGLSRVEAIPLSAQVESPAAPALGAPLEERLMGVSLMDEDGLRGVLAAMHDDWVHQGSRAEETPRALLRLRMIFSRWTDLSGDNALRAALALKDASLCDLALEAVMLEWSLRDTLAASQNITLIPWQAAQRRAVGALIRAGVQRSPAEGLASAAKISLLPQEYLRRVAGAEWMRRDASHALRFLMEEPGMKGAMPAGAALAQWLLEDPRAFFKWRKAETAVSGAIPLLRFAAETLTPGRLTHLAAVLHAEYGTPEAAVTWLRAAGGPGVEAVIAVLTPPFQAAEAEMKSWQAGAARPEASTVEGWLAHRAHARVLQSVAAGAEPSAVLSWLAALPEEEGAGHLAPVVARRWIAAAPESAPAQLFSGDLTNPVRQAAAHTAVSRMVVSNPRKALETLGSMPLDPAAAAPFRSTALQRLATADPAALLDWLGANPDIKASVADLGRALQALAATEAPRAIAWVRAHASAADSAALTAEIFSIWIEQDREEALKFLQSLSAGAAKDQIITQLVNSDIAVTDPFFAGNMLPDAFEQALQVSNDAGRLSALRSVITRLGQLQISTENLLKNPALRPADREALLKNP